jgi:hypothetical protein
MASQSTHNHQCRPAGFCQLLLMPSQGKRGSDGAYHAHKEQHAAREGNNAATTGIHIPTARELTQVEEIRPSKE